MKQQSFILKITMVGAAENVPLSVEEHIEVPTIELQCSEVSEYTTVVNVSSKEGVDTNKLMQLLAHKYEVPEGFKIKSIAFNEITYNPKPQESMQPEIVATRQYRRNEERRNKKGGGKT